MSELSVDIDDSEGSAMEFSDGNISFTPTEPNFMDIFLQSGKSNWTNQSDNNSNVLISVNATLLVKGTKGIYFPPDMVTFAAVCMILFAIASIVGNFIAICALSKSKKLNKITTAFIINLCVAHFCLSCCTLTCSVLIYRTQHWNGGDETCKFYNILIFFFASGVMFTINAVTINRYVLIVHTGYYYTIYSMRNTAIMVCLIWVISMVIALLPHFELWGRYGYDPNAGECAVIDQNENTEIYTYFVRYFLPLFLIMFCYAKIFYVVRKSERRVKRPEGSICSYLLHLTDRFWTDDKENDTRSSSYKELRSKKERRVFQMIFVIFLCFVLSFIPVTIMIMLRIEKEYPRLYIICHLGLHLSDVLNPIIYVVMNEEYRKAYKELFQQFRKR